MGTPTGFRVRWDQIDEQLLSAAHRRQHVGTLAEAEARSGFGPVSLSEIVQPDDGRPPSRHFGEVTTLLWWFVYRLFVGGSGPVGHPAGFSAKSVLLADVYEKPIPWGGTAYLSVWASPDGVEPAPPVLIPFPHIPEVLLASAGRESFAESVSAYRMLVAESVERVNLVAPAALALAMQGSHSD